MIPVPNALQVRLKNLSPDVVFFDEVVGIVGSFGPAQAGNPVVLLAVDEPAVGPFSPGELAVNELA